MRTELTELIGVLEQVLDAGRALLDASRRKCTALAGMKLDLIQQTTEQEDALTRRMHQLNERRRVLVASLTGEVPAGPGATGAHDGSLERLIEGLDEPGRTRLSVLRTTLAEVMKELQFVNVTNSIV
ncbi:MAG TPA: flagellar export chaperone FlgN, partial [Planctomycetota bacterium]|nr:flagellar export chaperone FlgN [Planctomycetota bacterium]